MKRLRLPEGFIYPISSLNASLSGIIIPISALIPILFERLNVLPILGQR
jgi:hypothetical protein